MPYYPDKYYRELNLIENQYARAVKGAHAMALREIYAHLDKQSEALGMSDINFILAAFGRVQTALKPIVSQFAYRAFILGNRRVANLIQQRGKDDDRKDSGEKDKDKKYSGGAYQIPYQKTALRSIYERNYDWVRKYGVDREALLKQELTEALGEDYSIKKLRDRIQQEFKTTAWRAECIARSETQKTYNESTRLAIINTGVVDQYQWETSHLESVCPVCRPLDGRIYNVHDINAPMPVTSTHPNCNCRVRPYWRD